MTKFMVHQFLVFLQHLNATASCCPIMLLNSVHQIIRLNHEGPVACTKILQLCILYSQFTNSYLYQFPLCQFLLYISTFHALCQFLFVLFTPKSKSGNWPFGLIQLYNCEVESLMHLHSYCTVTMQSWIAKTLPPAKSYRMIDVF